MHPRHALALMLVLVSPGCGSVSGGAGGGETTGSGLATGTGIGTASGVPTKADGAWQINLTGGPTCSFGSVQSVFGAVNATTIVTRENDGQPAQGDVGIASVTCSVTGTGPFAVIGSAGSSARNLSISIPTISAGATPSAPAIGSVSFSSAKMTAGAVYGGEACNFYFTKSTSEGVGPGKVWATFTCAGITNGQTQATCGVDPSYIVFESCSTM